MTLRRTYESVLLGGASVDAAFSDGLDVPLSMGVAGLVAAFVVYRVVVAYPAGEGKVADIGTVTLADGLAAVAMGQAAQRAALTAERLVHLAHHLA